MDEQEVLAVLVPDVDNRPAVCADAAVVAAVTFV